MIAPEGWKAMAALKDSWREKIRAIMDGPGARITGTTAKKRSDVGQVQTQVDAIWQKHLVLEKMSPTPPCDPSTDAKSPSGFRSPYGRGCYLLPTSLLA
jgi:hypothetical protein